LGSRLYALSMVGNGVDCAFRVGEWDWAVATLREWLDVDLSPAGRLELASDLVRFLACRGEDATSLVAQSEPLLDQVTDRQFAAYHWLGEAWRRLALGELVNAGAAVRRALEASPIFATAGYPLAARIGLWSRDRAAAVEALAALDATGYRATAVDVDRTTLRAGIAALDGEHQQAVGLYRDALERWRVAGLRWEEGLCGLDMAILLANRDPDGLTAAERTREILAGLGAMPFLDRLNAALSTTTLAGSRVPEGTIP
ncbi:MAG TPA: hypothetical protein VIV06_04175, partial [Candidatus Limnocylindrales bacterium]